MALRRSFGGLGPSYYQISLIGRIDLLLRVGFSEVTSNVQPSLPHQTTLQCWGGLSEVERAREGSRCEGASQVYQVKILPAVFTFNLSSESWEPAGSEFSVKLSLPVLARLTFCSQLI